jgi:urease subunit gamma/beta
VRPGEVRFEDGLLVLNAGRPAVRLRVHNTSDHTVQVSSHFHFFEVNRRLEFERERAYGMHLDLPAGRSIRFAPGEEREVDLVPYGGMGRAQGFRGLEHPEAARDAPGE